MITSTPITLFSNWWTGASGFLIRAARWTRATGPWRRRAGCSLAAIEGLHFPGDVEKDSVAERNQAGGVRPVQMTSPSMNR